MFMSECCMIDTWYTLQICVVVRQERGVGELLKQGGRKDPSKNSVSPEDRHPLTAYFGVKRLHFGARAVAAVTYLAPGRVVRSKSTTYVWLSCDFQATNTTAGGVANTQKGAWYKRRECVVLLLHTVWNTIGNGWWTGV